MASNPQKKAAAEKRAKAIYAKLMALPRPVEGFSNNDWTAKAGVSSSFFTNMQGNTKPASEPSIGNLRLALDAVGVTLSEFFLDEAEGRLIRPPTKQELMKAIADALPSLPKQADRRPEYLAEAVLDALALPPARPAKTETRDLPVVGAASASAPPRASTKKAGSAK